MKTIVISGVNIRRGGTLTIYKNLLDELINDKYVKIYKIVIMVSDKNIFEEYQPFFEIVEFPKEKKSRLYRFWVEYFFFKKYSVNNHVDIWISINDKTPNVYAQKQIVYCHNPMMFYKCTFKEMLYSPVLFVYTMLYKYIYRTNIEKNDFVIVQQKWIAEEFKKCICPNNEVLVFPPTVTIEKGIQKREQSETKTFFYPAIPKTFKNFEVLLEAARILYKNGYKFEVILTIDGSESRYTRQLVKLYSDVESVKFKGNMSFDDVLSTYSKTDCLLFPSKLETWGLPLTEAKEYGIDVLCADLPYSHETIGDYENVCFFNPNDAVMLAEYMSKYIDGTIHWDGNKRCSNDNNRYIYSWKEMIDILSEEK